MPAIRITVKQSFHKKSSELQGLGLQVLPFERPRVLISFDRHAVYSTDISQQMALFIRASNIPRASTDRSRFRNFSPNLINIASQKDSEASNCDAGDMQR